MMILPLAIFALLAWFRPRIALGVLLVSIPFYEITRFTIAGIPFTFPEVATYILVAALLLQGKLEARISKSETNPNVRNSKRWMFRLFDHLNFGFVSSFGFRISDFSRDPWVVLPLLWTLIAAISAAYSPAGMRAWGAWKAFFVAPVVLYFVIRYLHRSTAVSSGKNNESRIMNQGDDSDGIIHYLLFIILAIAAGAVITAAIAIFQRWWPIGVPYPWSLPGGFRATSVFGYPNAVGLFLAPLVPILIGGVAATFRSPRGGLKPAATFLAIAVTLVAAVVLAKSTGALIALGAVVLIIAVVIIARRRRSTYPKILGREKLGTRMAIGIITTWVLASVVITGALPYKRDLERIENPIVRKLAFGAWSGSVRLEQYRETWPMLLDHPLRGAGLTGYKQAFVPYHHSTVEIFPYPHNLLLAVWSELGLAGVLVFLAILYSIFRKLVTCHLSLVTCGILGALLVILVHGLVDVPYFKNDLSMLFWVIAALVATQRGSA